MWRSIITVTLNDEPLPFPDAAIALILKQGVLALLGSNRPQDIARLVISIQEEESDA